MQKKLMYFSVLLLFMACQRETSPPTPTPPNQTTKQCRLVKLIQGTHNGAVDDTTFTFYYDTSGKMISVTDHNPGYDDDKYTLTYDNSGRLIKVIDSSGYANSLFSYTGNGLLSDMRTFRLMDSIRMHFTYGSSTIPEKCKQIEYSYISNTWDSAIEYHYSVQNGNITSVEAFNNGVSAAKAYYEYDTVPNFNTTLALISQFSVPLGLYDQIWPFNKNAAKKKTINNSTGNYVGDAFYIKNKMDSGRLVKSEFDWLNPPTFTDTVQRDTRFYYYDCQ
jgi:hypothetical protein